MTFILCESLLGKVHFAPSRCFFLLGTTRQVQGTWKCDALPPPRMPVTTRIMTFFVGNSFHTYGINLYVPLLPTVMGWIQFVSCQNCISSVGGIIWLDSRRRITSYSLRLKKSMMFVLSYGCFQKWWYPQIINFNRDFHYKPSILGYPYFWKHPYCCIFLNSGVTCRSRRWNILGMVGIECVLPHSGENSDFEGMSELFAWIYGDQMWSMFFFH